MEHSELYDIAPYLTDSNYEEVLKKTVQVMVSPSNLRVLVAEDNLANLKIVQLILKPYISIIDTAGNGLIAFEKFKANKYDIIFMDIHMPEMDGYEGTQKIREYEKENNMTPVKIIAMTAIEMNEETELCLKFGMNQYLHKPFKRSDIIKIIRLLPS